MPENKLASIILRVANPKELAEWYQNVLGMSIKHENSQWICHYQESEDSACLKLLQATKLESKYNSQDKSSVYWKIGLALSDVDLARDKIMSKAVINVSAPSQFFDIGYMCHMNDSEGFPIELLQRTFQANFVKCNPIQDNALGQKGQIGQITLRCSDIEKSLGFYRDVLGMKLLSIQNVEAYGFTLYFLAYSSQDPPNSDLHSVDNREWLWQRPYTTLELQHIPGKSLQAFQKSIIGPDSIEIKVSQSLMQDIKTRLNIKTSESFLRLTDPDGGVIEMRAFH